MLMRHAARWHWISSAICLVGIIGFSATGITLNHAGQIGAEPRVTTREAELPEPLRAVVATPREDDRAPLPAALRHWLERRLPLSIADQPADWFSDEIYLDLPRPGGDAWLAIDRASGRVTYERSDRGWVAYFNDLHKGRHTGAAWRWFIDIFAAASLVFCLTGLLLLHLHARRRAATWPLVGFGLAAPTVLLVLLAYH